MFTQDLQHLDQVTCGKYCMTDVVAYSCYFNVSKWIQVSCGTWFPQILTADAQGWNIKPVLQKLQVLEWPLEAQSKNESIPTDPHIETPCFKANTNIFPT